MKRIRLWGLCLLCLFPGTGFADETLTVQPARKTFQLTGYTRRVTTLTLSSEVAGKVQAVHYEVGDAIVEKPFAEIDATFIDFEIENTRQSIRKIQAAQKKNDSQIAYLQKEFDRLNRLFQKDVGTESGLDQAREQLNQARLEADTLAAEEAALKVALAELRERRRRHDISAPKGWIVVGRRVEPGEIVTVNTPLAEIADFRNLVVPLSVTGQELAAMRALPEVFEARLEGEPVRTRIEWVNPVFNEKTRKLSTELVLVDYDGERRGGLRFTLPLRIESEGLRVPKSAVVSRYDNPRLTLKQSGETISVMVLGESEKYLIVADHPRLSVGTELAAP